MLESQDRHRKRSPKEEALWEMKPEWGQTELSEGSGKSWQRAPSKVRRKKG